ncbi:hypothetical protein PPH93_22165 [Achromobacter xylosoxidans]|uniref:hypothetical protein n=1 Tax=Alcaligenes xylosoxydans xylosoxydans TaxID=85698 RepID=UPI0023494551|nr:hypothetical protein [Achromobacter xylosoxidans]MDC6164369.1 hypothetical protein [Achromobacter xylosoxidans]
MNSSYEVVLQQVAPSDLWGVLKTLEKSSRSLSGLSVSEDVRGLDLQIINKNLVNSVVAYDGNICLLGRLHEFNVTPEISLPLVLLRVLKYQDDIDVELSFDERPFFDVDRILLGMKEYCDGLSNKFSVSKFYGGLEPAKDLDTRYFTGNASGSLNDDI